MLTSGLLHIQPTKYQQELTRGDHFIAVFFEHDPVLRKTHKVPEPRGTGSAADDF